MDTLEFCTVRATLGWVGFWLASPEATGQTRLGVSVSKWRTVWRGVVIFGAVLIVGAWPNAWLRSAFSENFSDLSNAALARVRLGGTVAMSLSSLEEPEAEARTQDGTAENVEADTQVVFKSTSGGHEARLGLSMRRDAYLPLLIFVGLILGSPLTPWRKSACLAVGMPVVLAVGIASVWALGVYLMSQMPGLDFPTWQRDLTELLFERWLAPPGNRVIAPLLLALGLGLYCIGRPRRTFAARVVPSRPREVCLGADPTLHD